MTGGEAAAPAWKLHTTALLPFLLVGYALQAVLWDRGWMMSELLWQHWIVKPLCLILVAFPLTFGALALGRSASRLGDGVPAAGRALLAVAPLGVLYLSALALFN